LTAVIVSLLWYYIDRCCLRDHLLSYTWEFGSFNSRNGTSIFIRMILFVFVIRIPDINPVTPIAVSLFWPSHTTKTRFACEVHGSGGWFPAASELLMEANPSWPDVKLRTRRMVNVVWSWLTEEIGNISSEITNWWHHLN
jgi:hypothetical protein